MSKRNNRVFEKQEGGWYFTKRGDRPQGPYPNQASAEQALNRFVRGCLSREQQGRAATIWPRVWNPLRLFRKGSGPTVGALD